MRLFTYLAAYIFGVALALLAAISGSISPDGPWTVLGEVLARFYGRYFELFCGPLDGLGFLITLMLSGVPFIVLVWLCFCIYDRAVGRA